MVNPGQPELAGNSLGQPSDGSSFLGSIDNYGAGIQQLPQHSSKSST
jgi:hypothetical protein